MGSDGLRGRRHLLYAPVDIEENSMPNLSDSRRKKIQARQRKAENTKKREAKIAKKDRNAKAGAAR
jgi:hypothetical protein